MGINELFFNTMSSDSWVLCNKKIAKKFGLTTAALLGELIYEWKYWKDRNQAKEGWFFSTIENIEQTIGIGERHQRSCIKKLIEANFLEQENIGIPRKRYFRINAQAMLSFLEENTSSSCSAQATATALSSENKNKNKLGSEEEKSEIKEVISLFNDGYRQFKNEDYKVRKSDIHWLNKLPEKDFNIVRSVFTDLRFFLEQHVDLLGDEIELTIALLLKVPFRFQQIHDYYNQVLADSLEEEQQYWKNKELRLRIEQILNTDNLFLKYLEKIDPKWVILHRQGRYTELENLYENYLKEIKNENS